MTRPTQFDGPVVFDCEALIRVVAKDPYFTGVVMRARASLVPIVISAATIVEAAGFRIKGPAMVWTVSRFTVRPLTKEIAIRAAGLLASINRNSHSLAIDAMVCATALLESGRPTIYTSDPSDIELLTAGKADVIPLL